jgi:hypothetical protein
MLAATMTPCHNEPEARAGIGTEADLAQQRAGIDAAAVSHSVTTANPNGGADRPSRAATRIE